MASIFAEFGEGFQQASGPRLAASLAPIAPPEYPDRLRSFYAVSDGADLYSDVRYAFFQTNRIRLPKQEQNAWIDILSACWKATGEILNFDVGRGSWVRVFETWREVANFLSRGYSVAGFQAWTIPCLYTVGKYLRTFAIRADAEVASQGSAALNDRFQDDIAFDSEAMANLEEAARVINKMFILCLNDRSSIEESRKWGVYNMTNLMFKTYFKINSVGLCKNLLRALSASSVDLPSMDAFPKSHIVTFEYYVGVLHFLDEDYAVAEEHLAHAWKLCHKEAHKNRELILTYLIPCHIVTTHTLPSKRLLAPFLRLEKLFQPLCDCIKKGDLRNFDAGMLAGEDEFVKRRIYLPLERGRDIALRNLFRKVFLAGGFEPPKDDSPPIRRTRIPVIEFAAALRIGTHADGRLRVDIDEVECLLSNLIYKGLMKGYIARERGMVVLSKGGAFPGTGV